MNKTKLLTNLFACSILTSQAFAANVDQKINNLQQELKQLHKTYESRIDALESKLSAPNNNSKAKNFTGRKIYGNEFNPSIGLVLNGKYANFSKDTSEFAGFAVGEEGERGRKGFAIDESELNFSSNIDDKFFGSLTAAIVREDGADKIELEEAYIQTIAGANLPDGLSLKFGRAFWKLGYLNDKHAHSDDFADRPLPNRVFLNKAYNDDGVELSYILPTNFYAEIGGGSFRGDDFPFATGDGTGNVTSFVRLGGDLTANQDWRIGYYNLSGEAKKERVSNEANIKFIGDVKLDVVDFRYNFAPTGNAKNSEISLQAEYFSRSEDGTYEDVAASTGAVKLDAESSGWYAQLVYKFLPQWRIGIRQSELSAANVPTGLANSALDAKGFDPSSSSIMLDYTNSEFSRIRLQYNQEELSQGNKDNQFLAQYVMSFGAHSSHKY